MGHDFDARADPDFSFQNTFMENDDTVPDGDFGADDDLMPGGEAMADYGVRVNNRSGANNSVVAHAELFLASRILIAQDDSIVNLSIFSNFTERFTGHGRTP